MGVLAIAQGLAQQSAQGAAARRFGFAILGQFVREPVGHRRVISRGAGISPLRQGAAKLQGGGAIMRRHFVQHGFIVFDIHHHGHPIMVLGGGTGHGWATDIDILDSGFEIGATRHRGLERIKIADQKIDAFDAMGAHRLGMILLVAQRQKAAMHIGMQRLHPPVHHLGEIRDLGDIGHLEPRIAQRLGGAAGGDEADAVLGQALGEVDQSGLVGNRKQGAGNLAVGHAAASRGDEGGRRSYRFMIL